MSWYWDREDAYTRNGIPIEPTVELSFRRRRDDDSDEPVVGATALLDAAGIDYRRENSVLIVAIPDATAALRAIPPDPRPRHCDHRERLTEDQHG